MTTTAATEQVYRIFIKASAEQIWDAITKPEFTAKYFHGARISVSQDEYRSLGPTGDVWGDAAVTEYDPPHRLDGRAVGPQDPFGDGRIDDRSDVTANVDRFCTATVQNRSTVTPGDGRRVSRSRRASRPCDGP